MKHFLVTIAGVFTGLLLFFVGVPFVLVLTALSSARPAAAVTNAVLSLDLRQSLSDQDVQSPLAFLNARSLSVMSVVSGINRARRDPNVRALLIRLPEGGMAPAAADAIGRAVRDFHAQGKPVIAHSQGVYPSGQPVATYMLGATSGDFWMQPASSLQAVGSSAEDMFFKRAFDKYGVKADYEQRYQYKNAVNPYLFDDYTPAHREGQLGWMTSIYESEIATAAAARKTDPKALRDTLEGGPYLAETALAKSLIDHVGQVEDAVATLKAAAGDGAKLQDFTAYIRSARTPVGAAASASSLALIEAEGEITTGSSRDSGLNGGGGIRSDDMVRAFQAAIDDTTVKAIVFRVSSPGGSDTASEQILSAVRAAKAAGKPVVVSMGTYAASGGYWISSQASEIVAEPTTLTGSIGVFGGKFVIGPALAKFGVDTRDLSVGGQYAGAFGSATAFTPAQKAAFAGWMDQIYAGFVARVAEGRRLKPERVAEIAKGRVWTGVQAKALGLVDKLGGLGVAVAEAKRLGGLSPTDVAAVKRMTQSASPMESLSRLFGGAQTSVQALSTTAQWLADPRAQQMIHTLNRTRLQSLGQATVLADVPAL